MFVHRLGPVMHRLGPVVRNSVHEFSKKADQSNSGNSGKVGNAVFAASMVVGLPLMIGSVAKMGHDIYKYAKTGETPKGYSGEPPTL